METGYIYLIREREYVRTKEEVTKAGRTGDIMRRMKQYPKGSRVLLCMLCQDYKRAETEILALLGNHYKARRDIGTETFEGDTKGMIGMVASYITARSISGAALTIEEQDETESEAREVDSPTMKTREEVKENKEKRTEHRDIAVARFMETEEAKEGKSISSIDLFGRFLDFVKKQETWKTEKIEHTWFSRAVVHTYGATSEVRRMGESTQRVLVFPEAPPEPNAKESEKTVLGFVREMMDKTGEQKDHVTLKAAYEAYEAYSRKEKKKMEKKGDFKEELLATLGEFSPKSNLKRNYWRGWVLKQPIEEDGGTF